jgi:methylated-DNA-[protein]-cysteine S-methyltransferase
VNPVKILFSRLDSPVGELLLTAAQNRLLGVYWEIDDSRIQRLTDDPCYCEGRDNFLDTVSTQLEEYFRGLRLGFDLPVAPAGTAFQQRVWQHLQAIPYGQTRSYGEIAVQLDKPRGARAVGAAIGRNPIAIIIPCHRVVGRGGALTGFAGGLPNKQWLLEHELRVG